MKVTYLGIIKDQFRYSVELNNEVFDYSTGLGWIELKYKGKTSLKIDTNDEKINAKLLNVLNPFSKRYLTVSNRTFKQITGRKSFFRKEPSNNDILECLYLDSQAGLESFQDFCDCYCYDNDSIKALKIYMACQDTSTKLRGFKFPDNIINGEF